MGWKVIKFLFLFSLNNRHNLFFRLLLKDAYLLRYEFQVYRFVTPIFLHADLSHILMNVVVQLMIGSSVEASLGPLKFLILYFVAGIGGNLFSALCSDTNSVGASTSIFGLIGCYIAFIAINWSHLRQNSDKFCRTLIYLALSLFISSSLGAFSNVDVMGHLGGFITGGLCGLILLEQISTG